MKIIDVSYWHECMVADYIDGIECDCGKSLRGLDYKHKAIPVNRKFEEGIFSMQGFIKDGYRFVYAWVEDNRIFVRRIAKE